MNEVDKFNARILGEKVKIFRRELSYYSMNSFAEEKSNITPACWSRIENGKVDPKLSTLIKISAAFDMPLYKLIRDLEFDYSSGRIKH